MTQKFFCYVDETGQDTQGELFIVTVVTASQERNQLRQACEDIERDSRKGRRKWVKTTYSRRLAYIRQVLERPIFEEVELCGLSRRAGLPFFNCPNDCTGVECNR